MVTVSTRGALIRARTNDSLGVGSFVDISIDRGRGVVEIRHIQPSHEPSIAYYGVQFFELDSRLREMILELTRSAVDHGTRNGPHWTGK